MARGEDTCFSDIDLLVAPGPGASLFDLVGFKIDVEDLTGYRVDVTSDRELTASSGIARDAPLL